MTVELARSVRKFNPGTLQSDEELKRQFVVRRKELDIVLDVLRSNADAASCQQMMVVAPRGMGKTMLLARVSAELRTDGALSERLLPVRFMEESLEVFDLSDFWLETLFQLAQEVARREPELADELRKSRADLLSRGGPDVAEQTLAAVVDAAERLNRRLVLMVENMQNLCRDVDADFGWQLRGVLQTEPRIMLVGTATTRFEDLEAADKAFFELFRFLDLRPLDTDGCGRLWSAISGEDVTQRAIRPLEILTGGSPRLLVIVAHFARHRSLKQLMEELVIVIDEHTEYFRGHLEALAKGERRIYVAVIDLWQPSSTGEISERARMDVRATSTLLGRLVTRGLVGFEGKGQRRRYVATERLYTIYYKLRRERDEAAIVMNLIRFMVAFYSGDELRELFVVLSREPLEAPLLEGFLPAVEGELAETVAGLEPHGELARALVARRASDVIEKADQLLEGGVFGTSELRVLLVRAFACLRSGDAQAAFEAFDAADERLGSSAETAVPGIAASVSLMKAMLLGQLGRPDEEVDAYDALIARFEGDRDDAHVAHMLLRTLSSKAGALRKLGDLRATVHAVEDAERMFDAREAPELRLELARMLALKGAVLQELGQGDAAFAVYERIVAGHGASQDLPTQEIVANALIGQASVHFENRSFAAAEACCEDLLGRHGSSKVEPLRTRVATALIAKGAIASGSGRHGEALRIAADVERRYGTLADHDGATFAWRAGCLKVLALAALGRGREALETLRTASALFKPTSRAIGDVTRLVGPLMSIGVSPEDVLEVIVVTDREADVLRPLRVALELQCGRDVRGPEEVLEVAADIRKDWTKSVEG